MGGKKKGKGKGGKGKGKKQDNPLANLTLEEQYNARQVEWKSLQQLLIKETEIADHERAGDNELRSKVTVLSSDLKEEKRRTWDVTCDITRQFKSMQHEKDEKIQDLQEKIVETQNKVKQRDNQYNEILGEKDSVIREKDDEIRELKTKINEMSARFTKMLQETLEQMKDKIEMVNKNWEEEMETPMLKKLEEFSH